MMAFFWSTQNT